MRLLTLACSAALAVGFAAQPRAETVAVTQLLSIPANGVANVRLVCPEDFEISGEAQTYTSRSPKGLAHSDLHFLDRRGNVAPQDDAGAQELTVRDTLSTATDVSVVMLCAKRENPPVVATATLVPLGSSVLFGSCPTGMAPAGAVANIDGSALRTNYQLFKYGNAYLDTLPDGNSIGPPTSIELFAGNTLQSLQALRMTTRCVPAAGLETIVQSVPTSPGSSFTLFVPVPDGYDFVGMTKDPGTDGAFTLAHIWLADGTVSSLPPYAETDGHAGRVKGMFLDGVDRRPAGAKAGARAYVGVLVRKLATAQPPRPLSRSSSSTTRHSITTSSRQTRRRSGISTAACTRVGRARARRSMPTPWAAPETPDGVRCAARMATRPPDSTRTSTRRARRSAWRR